MSKVSAYIMKKANEKLNNLIGNQVFQTFIFYEYCKRYDIQIDSLEKFLYLYRDILKEEQYSILYNDYYPTFEELTKPKKVEKKKINRKAE